MAVALPFRPAYVETGTVPSTIHYAVKSGEDFVAGAPLTINAGEVDELDTDDVTLIVGVAAAADESAFGYDMGDSPTVVTGRANTVPVWRATRDTVFIGQLSNGTSALVVPDAANVGVAYGVIRQSDGTWTVDENDTTNDVVTVIDFVTQGPECSDASGLVYFKFLQSTLYA
jgi:hypothetical protein